MPKPPAFKPPIAYEAYQTLAEAYDQKVDTKPHNAYYERPAMLSLLPDLQGKHVLDAGCGPGAYSQELAKRGAKIIAVDVSDRMLELAGYRLAQQLAAKQVELRLVDLTKPLVMFADEQFDFVNAPLCFDYIEDWRALFQELFRVLKPNGQILFSCGHSASDAEYYNTEKYFEVEQVSAWWKGFGKKVLMPSFRRPLTEILMPLVEAGFVLEKIHEPLPTEEFLKSDSKRFHALEHRPVFLCIGARKP